MNNTQHALVAFLVLVGLFAGYWIVGGLVGRVFNHVADTTTTYTFPSNHTNIASGDDQKVDIGPNVSQQVASNLSGIFVTRTHEASASTSPQSVLDSVDLNSLGDVSSLADSFSVSDLGLVSSVDPSLLHIVPDSPTSIASYWDMYGNELGLFSTSVADATALQDAFNVAAQSGDFSAVNKMVSDYQNIFVAISQMDVPQSLVDFHSKNVVFFKNMVTVLQGLSHYQTDPIKAYVLSQYFPHLLDTWNDVGTFITKYAPLRQ